MRTRIISAFPGTGKSYYYNKHKESTLDSDSSEFSWVIKDDEKIRNPDFPNNYIKHIKENIGKYKFILVSSHKVVRDALLDNCIHFYLMYPTYQRKDEYLQRYVERGSPEKFIELLDKNWEGWIRECEDCTSGCTQVRMVYENLEKELNHMVSIEESLII